MIYKRKGICNAALPVTLLLFLFVPPERDKISYNLAKQPIAFFRNFSNSNMLTVMDIVISES